MANGLGEIVVVGFSPAAPASELLGSVISAGELKIHQDVLRGIIPGTVFRYEDAPLQLAEIDRGHEVMNRISEVQGEGKLWAYHAPENWTEGRISRVGNAIMRETTTYRRNQNLLIGPYLIRFFQPLIVS